MKEQLPQLMLAPPEHLIDWVTILYYGAGTVVAIAVAYRTIRGIIRRRKKEK
jgi:hypothetical protein